MDRVVGILLLVIKFVSFVKLDRVVGILLLVINPLSLVRSLVLEGMVAVPFIKLSPSVVLV